MKLNDSDKLYLDKLRTSKIHKIPSNSEIEKVLERLSENDEEVVDDLIIRTWDGEIEFELI